MKKENKSLSEEGIQLDDYNSSLYFEEDVKEAVKRLLEYAKEHDDMESHLPDGFPFNPDCNCSFTHKIKEIFGEEFV